jgi:glycosyltransferase involved in cell wall biosynthesis
VLSVCVCTYNRAQSLARTLDTLVAQIGVNWANVEVVVIDNNCTDDTADVVAAAAARLPVRRVIEQAQGLANARNRALAVSRGRWIIFTDDDVLLERDWLRSYTEAFDAFPKASFAAGRIVPLWKQGRPGWFKGERLDLMNGVLGWYDIGTDVRAMTLADPEPFGANFAVRRVLVESIGVFEPSLGMHGKKLGRGEETEFFIRAKAAGAKGIYVGRALCHHPVEADRLSLPALYRYGVVSGRAYRVIMNPRESGSRLKGAAFLARGMLQLLKGRGDRFRQCVINAGIQAGLISHE